MNAIELINSGILEAYVLGQASDEEVALVERMRITEGSVRAELEALNVALEDVALRGAVKPPEFVKTQIMDRIAKDNSAREPIRMMPQQTSERSGNSWQWLAAASIIGLLFSVGLNVYQHNKLDNVKEELARSEQQRSVFAQEIEVQRTSLEHSKEQLAVLQDPNASVITLQGMGAAAGRTARVYWDKTSAEVYVDHHSIPPPPAGKQYQLWILVDGNPVDAGVLPLSDPDGLERMKDVQTGQTFAVTIEKLGGSESPDLSALVFMGQV
ncbi:MAG: anti-sigma factor [Flavobacteriales bacterium]